MKAWARWVGMAAVLVLLAGCTQIVRLEPSSGPPGTPVYVTCRNVFGNPVEATVLWDGHRVGHEFYGSFVVPEADAGGQAGKHTVTVIDDVDADEAFLVFPLFRMRHDTAQFMVTALPTATAQH